jgi:hypothetical protein
MFRIVALLATDPAFPEGDVLRGIELTVPLLPQGRVDPSAASGAGVRRFWPDREDWRGALEPVEGGWGLRNERDPDDPVWVIELAVIRPGEYISLRRPNGEEAVFRIVSVEPA